MRKKIVFLAITAILFAACEEEKKKEEPKEKINDELVGTTWKGYIGAYHEIFYIEFGEDNQVVATISDYNTTTDTDYGTYSLAGKNVTFSGLSVSARACTVYFGTAKYTNAIMTIRGTYCGKSGTWTFSKVN